MPLRKFMMKSNMKISRKIALTHSLIFLGLQIFIGSTLLFILRLYYPIEASREIYALSNTINQNIASYSNSIDEDSRDALIPTIPSKYVAFIKLINEKGEILLTYGTVKAELDVEEPYNKIREKESHDVFWVYCNSPVRLNENEQGVLQIAIDITQYIDFNSTLFVVLLLVTLLGFILSFCTGSIVGRVALQPISKMIKTANRIRADRLDVRIETNGTKDEIYELAVTLNEMISRLQYSFEKQEQLISDVSHELKTPVSVIKGYISLLERWGREEPKVLDESISRIGREVENMSGIIEDLLFLARKDNGTLILDKSKFEMNNLIDEVIEDAKVVAPECKILIEKNEAYQFLGDYRLLKQLIRILIDNSVKYGDKDNLVKVYSEKKEDNIELVVQDSGVGIATSDLEKIFNRFYRADKARTRNKGGTGLGLAIAKAIVQEHNGSIRVESEISKGTRMIVELPYNILSSEDSSVEK